MPSIKLLEEDLDSSGLEEEENFPSLASELAVRGEAKGQVVMAVIQQAIDGVLPYPEGWREAHTNGVGVNRQKHLRPYHINMILDRMSYGLTHEEIAHKYNCARKVVSFAMKHPHAEMIIAAVLGSMADRITDPRERLQGYAHEALSSVVSVMRTTKSDGLRGKMALSILDRAGFGVVQKVETRNTHDIHMQVAHAESLSKALTLSAEVASIDYTEYLYRTPPQGGGSPTEEIPAQTPDSAESSAEGLGSPEQVLDPPSSSHPQTEPMERTA